MNRVMVILLALPWVAQFCIAPAWADLAADRRVLNAEHARLVADPTAGAVGITDGPTLHPGDAGPVVAQLRHALAAYRYLDPGDASSLDWPVYDDLLVQQVEAFQMAVGLVPDGAVGMATRKALRFMDGDRLRMIEQSLAQPDRPAKGRYILVNLAAATVTAMQDDNVVMVSRAVIGRKDHPTPTFSSRITAVWINPSWVVPESIVIREFGGNAHTEKPGPNNPLGRLFFEMPNQYEVFLHSTNEPYLFNRDERAFSHGCVRVRDVMAMARWLMGEDRWQDEAVDVALHGLVTKRIALDRSVPIYIDYRTATVAPTGAVVYHADPYGLAAPPPDESPPPDGAVPPATAQSAAAIAVPN